jgi:hypothetical protein
MSEQLRKRTEEALPLSFRTSTETRRQIDELMEHWGENQSQAVVRSIERTWIAEIGSKQGIGVVKRSRGKTPKRRLTGIKTTEKVTAE